MTKFWGSRFPKETDNLADKFSFSISYDYRLAKYDIITSIAHAKMLAKCKIIPQKDSSQIVDGLKKIEKEIDNKTFKFDKNSEDIHTNLLNYLKNIIGPAADKLHTARSRNDLIVTDMKLYCLVELTEIYEFIAELQRSIVKFAEANKHIIIPAYTHLQSAQVVLLAHYLLAYVEMLERDKLRIFETIKRTNTMPLGSCALSGTSLPIDRNYTAIELGFSEPTANSIDSVSDRDFIIEALSDLAILGIHFSRMCEDFILWSTTEFNFINIDWSLCTGSSIMPHKKNPDILELIRGESAGLISNLNSILVLMKGMPLTYNRDLQLDKPPLFESVKKSKLMVQLLTKLFTSLKVNEEVLKKRVEDELFFSVDLMEHLISKGASYREAHDAVGQMIKECVEKNKKISALNAGELKKYSSKFNPDIKKLLNSQNSVKIKKSLGSTNPSMVHQQLINWKKKLTAKS